jgi:uncharacterized membrane protein
MLHAAEGESLTVGDFAFARTIAEWIEYIAIFAIATAVLVALVAGVVAVAGRSWNHAFEVFKRYIARGLLIGLDLLIAGDIIKTVTVEPTLENVLILGLLVVIRTFLSWALVLEVEGRWPWQPPPPA